jgi:thiol-disulfide isomerase/thioredoxin
VLLTSTGLPARAGWAEDSRFAVLAVSHDRSPTAAPDFSLRTPEGQTLTLSGFRGRVVFLNFWATWCAPCRIEMPEMERLHRDFQKQGLVVLAVDLQESPKLVTKFMRDFRLSFPALLDADSRVAVQFRVQGLPTTILIARDGRSLGRAIGPREWAGPEGRALIRDLLDRR